MQTAYIFEIFCNLHANWFFKRYCVFPTFHNGAILPWFYYTTVDGVTIFLYHTRSMNAIKEASRIAARAHYTKGWGSSNRDPRT